MDKDKLQKHLKGLGACTEAVKWAEGKTLKQAYSQCTRADWLLWLFGKMIEKPGWPDRNQLVLTACDCAETALKYVTDGEDRPRKAIEAARAWTRGEATLEDVRIAAYAAYAADAAAAHAAAAAASAADAAAYAADAAAYAADAAAYAADAAAAAHENMCEIIRKRLKLPVNRIAEEE